VTIEAPVDLAAALGSVPADSFIIVDCLTIWISNLLEWRNEAEILEASREVIERTTARTAPVVVVSNEVGMGLVPMHLVGRAFRDIAGRVNQQWVAAADRSCLVMAGQVSELSPVPDVL
jgi:adenosyl cobinamide kinase/adenosyl cobinamide phosphate guanylyltransferase